VKFLAPLLLLCAACASEPMHGTVMDPPSAAPPLVTAGDSTVPAWSLKDEAGRTVVLFFGYTHCPDVCPTVLADWARAKRALGADTTRIRFVFVAMDPGRDTPARTHQHARQFDPAILGVATTDAEVARITRDWGFAVYPEGDPRTPNYTVAHPAQSFVVDRKGRLRLMLPPGVRGEDIAKDLRRIR